MIGVFQSCEAGLTTPGSLLLMAEFDGRLEIQK